MTPKQVPSFETYKSYPLGLGRYAVLPYQIHVDTDTRLYPINLLDIFVSDTAGNRSIPLWNLERNSRSRQSGTDTRVRFQDTRVFGGGITDDIQMASVLASIDGWG
ncbi:hypothetical protein AVEN_153435-1 [Araneus ventricosus]|uniref:Uncharacterized protein n=1 Tax=Araneus ventricosus TaxID=182803 RepID=A0A4Y2QK63_ARAVE|nr:hypothetical protein AVEN_153435-1 [Araneus ventricosus]